VACSRKRPLTRSQWVGGGGRTPPGRRGHLPGGVWTRVDPAGQPDLGRNTVEQVKNGRLHLRQRDRTEQAGAEASAEQVKSGRHYLRRLAPGPARHPPCPTPSANPLIAASMKARAPWHGVASSRPLSRSWRPGPCRDLRSQAHSPSRAVSPRPRAARAQPAGAAGPAAGQPPAPVPRHRADRAGGLQPQRPAVPARGALSRPADVEAAGGAPTPAPGSPAPVPYPNARRATPRPVCRPC
jgi:hypothetical protein